MRVFLTLSLVACLAPKVGMAKPASNKGTTGFAVLYPYAGAQAQQAGPALQKFGAQIAKKGGWANAQGQIFSRRAALRKALTQGSLQADALILPLSAYLDLKQSHPRWKASHEVSLVSPQQGQFFLVTTDAKRSSCAGAKVATNHLDESPFLSQVVSGGSQVFAQMQWVQQRRPIQVLKTLIRGQAQCALIDQAQLEAARQLPGGAATKVLWSSPKLPSMVAVLRKQEGAWKKVLGTLCRGASSPVCQEVGLLGFDKLSASRIRTIERQYARPPRRSASAKAAPAL